MSMALFSFFLMNFYFIFSLNGLCAHAFGMYDTHVCMCAFFGGKSLFICFVPTVFMRVMVTRVHTFFHFFIYLGGERKPLSWPAFELTYIIRRSLGPFKGGVVIFDS